MILQAWGWLWIRQWLQMVWQRQRQFVRLYWIITLTSQLLLLLLPHRKGRKDKLYWTLPEFNYSTLTTITLLLWKYYYCCYYITSRLLLLVLQLIPAYTPSTTVTDHGFARHDWLQCIIAKFEIEIVFTFPYLILIQLFLVHCNPAL